MAKTYEEFDTNQTHACCVYSDFAMSFKTFRNTRQANIAQNRFLKNPCIALAMFHCLTVFTCQALDDVIKCSIVKFGNLKISRTETTFKSR